MLLLALLACTPDDAQTVDVVPTDHPAVLRVEWQGDAEVAEVHWTDDFGGSHVAAARSDGSLWEATLVVGAETTIELEVVADGEVIGTASAATEGEAPDVDLQTEGVLSAPIATTMEHEEIWYAVVLGLDGRLRWWQEVVGFDMACVRVRLGEEGVWTTAFDVRTMQERSEASLFYLSFDGSEVEEQPFPGHHHDFDFLEDGSMVWLGNEELELDPERTVDNDHLFLTTPEGEIISLFDVASSWPADAQAMGEDGAVLGWANHLDVDGDEAWVSLRDLNRVVGVTTSGEMVGTLGDAGDWNPSSPFASQHGGSVTSEGIIMHDNAGGESVRIVEYALADSGEAPLIWEYTRNEQWNSPALGDALRLDNGNTLISWGIFSSVEELDEGGDTVGLLTYDEQVLVGYLTVLPADF